jgi:butyryl-CoA dehydrogenase
MGAVSIAMAAYLASLDYAQERTQGRLPSEKNPLNPPALIIQHADVQRMLLTQKAIVEGGLALTMECNRQFDLAHAAAGDAKQEAWLLLEILTPIVKAWCSEQANRSAALAIQTFGGYGYTMDFPVQQYYRDLKIFTLYEGTTGIQSLDLLGRKVSMEKGMALQLLLTRIKETIDEANTHESLKAYSNQLNIEVQNIRKVLEHLNRNAGNDADRYLSDATVFMDLMGCLVVAWQWLKQATSAQVSLSDRNFSRQSQSFYEGIIHTMKFYFRYELPHAEAYAKTLMNPDYLVQVKNKQLF